MTSLLTDVRPARLADAAALAEVYAEAWGEAYSGIIPGLTLRRMIARRGAGWWRAAIPQRTILVLEVGGALAGYVSFAAAPGRGHPGAAEIQELYLKPVYQGLGLGVRLFAAAVARVRGRGYTRVLVRALAENERANGFYRHRGGRLLARSEESLGGRVLPCLWYEFRV